MINIDSKQKAIVIFSACLAYAVFRYNIAGPVEWIQIPTFILNKATAMASIAFLVLKLTQSQHETKSKFWGKCFGISVITHILLSFAVMSPSYFPKFYDNGHFNLVGNLMVVSGILSGMTLWQLSKKGALFHQGQIAALLLLLLHITMIGWYSWFKPLDWYGYLPPISLICACLTAVALRQSLITHSSQNS